MPTAPPAQARSPVVDAYPLSPMQEGMLFHTLYDPDGAVYFEQFRLTLDGEIDADALERAWRRAIERHPILRTAFVWEGVRRPHQVVLGEAPFRLERLDWSALAEPERRRRLADYLEADRRRGFDLAAPPLMRLTLMRLGGWRSWLVWRFHHLLLDGWSGNLLLGEVFAHYEALRSGGDLDLPERPPFRRYIAWLGRQDASEAESFWRRYLVGFTRPTPLTVDRRREDEVGYAKSLRPLPRALAAGLRELVRSHRLTLNTALQGAWALVLSRYSGSSDVLFGATSSGRPAQLPGVQEMVGLFVNTLPARVEVDDEAALLPWLERLQVGQAEVRQYEHVALPRIQGWSDVPSGEPLFESIQGLENYAVGGGPGPGAPGAGSGEGARSFEIVELEAVERTNYPLTILGIPGEGLAIEIWYELGRFDRATVERLQGHLASVLAGFVGGPGSALGGISLLAAAERRQLVAEWNDTARPLPVDERVERWVAERARLRPEATAVAAEDGEMTYGELAAGAAALARRLRALGIGPESLVGVALERSRRMPMALLGVLEAGAAYVPLDPAYPPERLAAMLEATSLSVVVTEERLLAGAGADLAASLAARGVRTIPLDRLEPELLAEGGADPPELVPPMPPVPPEALAYVVFTSGSTGRPKGIAISRRSLANLTLAFQDRLALSARDRLLMIPSLSFDASVGDIFPTLCAGATLVLHPDPARLSGVEMLRFCARREVSVLDIPAAFWRQLVASLGEHGSGRGAADALGVLRLVIAGGESIAVREIERWAEASGRRVRFFGPYGPTEATVCATAYVTLDASELPPDAARLPIGRPLPNTRVHLLDRSLRTVPVAVPGEVHLGGLGIARGYLDVAETADRFVPDPFAGRGPASPAGGRLYRTGDLARWLPGGTLEFVGRRDAQIKVRGFRIEPQEIEATLARHPAVREAVVLASGVEGAVPRLVAFVVADPGPPGLSAPSEEAAAPGDEDDEDDEGMAQVDSWRLLFDQTYREGSEGGDGGDGARPDDPELDFQGWNASDTGEPIPREEMRAWADSTVERILAAGSRPAGRVLEIGCGTGLILLRLARHCDLCCGTDFSPVALGALERALAVAPRRAEVRLAAAAADDLSAFGDERFDAVVLNSVAQYFPSVDYLLRVLERAIERVAPGGFLFLGDLRSRPLERALQTRVELAAAAPGTPRAELAARVERALIQDEELTLGPALFTALERRWPRVAAAEVLLKRGPYDNELVRFRYDVVLHLDEGGPAAGAPRISCVDGLVNARTAAAVRAAGLLAAGLGPADAADLRRLAAAPVPGAVEPDREVDRFAGRPDVRARATVSPAGPDRFALVIAPPGPVSTAAATGTADDGRPWTEYANDPLRARRERRTLPELRRFLADRLPEYMVPSAFVFLDELPVTPNGKADRSALAALEVPATARRDEAAPYVAPRSAAEERLAAIWAEVLGVERVGVDDDFFRLGGHSLLATQVISRMRSAFGVELPIRRLFEAPTVAELARALAEEDDAPGDALPAPPPLVPRTRRGPIPLSFAQERLWFLDQLEGGSAQYNMPFALALTGRLELPALARALDEIVRRHEVLRTTFAASEGRPFQVIHPPAPPTPGRWPLIDLSGLGGAEERELARIAGREGRRPFDLAAGPLARAVVVRRAAREHALLLAFHHTVADGWSVGVLVRELSALYTAFTAGRRSPLPELPVQYADFARWQREWLDGARMAARLEYWRARLAGLPPALDLPSDRPRPPVLSARGGHRPVRLPRALSDDLRRLSDRAGSTLFMTLLAGFALLLHRYSGQDDLAVGTPVAGRGRLELEPLIGVFVNTLVLRLDAAGNPGFLAFLDQARRHTLDAHAHDDLPFERLVDALDPDRDLSRNPLFQAMFGLQSLPRETIELPGLTLRPGPEAETGAAQVDLSLTLVEAGDAVAGSLEYSCDLFDAATVDRMAAHLENLLAGAVARPDAALCELPLAGEAERRQLLAWGAPREPGLAAEDVVGRFLRQAERTPDAVAVDDGERRLRYADLARAALRLAHRLVGQGAGPDRRVAICLERSPELIVALLGVLAAGAAYVPIDPAYPPERRRRMLADSDPVAILAAPGDVPLYGSDSASLGSPPQPEALAYVIYTSGSGGAPKGVGVPRRAFATYVEAARRLYGIGPADRVLQVASVAFDASVEEIFPALVCGATVVLRPSGPPGAVDELLSLCRRREVTVLPLPTAYWHEMARAPEELDLPESLRLVILGGEEARADRVLAWYRATGDRVRLVNTYGPTEATVVATSFEAAADPDRPRVPIGRPLLHVRAVVLDQAARRQAAGVPGQLWLGGSALARGYLGRPAETAESFVPDPFMGALGGRLYATGDRARWLADGELDFLGRVDRQVKLRGFRVELGEVEAVLRQAPGVRDVVVTVRRTGAGRLAAWVVGDEPADGAARLRRFVAERLPEFMVPAAVSFLPDLPRMPTGKIDRPRLAETAPSSAEVGPRVAPRTAAERALGRIWSEVLGVEGVGVRDDFFELGGDSISSIQVVARARRAGLGLDPRQVFQHRTLGALAAAARPVSAVAAVAAEQGAVVGEVLLTPIQRWFFEQDVPARGHWNQAVMLTLDPGGVPALGPALARLLDHHDALRLRFVEREGDWRASCAQPEAPAALIHVDLARLPAARRREALDEVTERVQRSLDLAHGPLLRAAHLALGDGAGDRLLLVVHHLAVDGVSWRILLEDLEALCAAFAAGRPADLPPKTTSWRAWSDRLRDHARSGALASTEAESWRAVAAAARPAGGADPGLEAEAGEVRTVLDPETTSALVQGAPTALHARLDEVLLAGVALAFARLGRSRLVLELESHGRDAPFEGVDLTRTVGWFTALFPVVLLLDPGLDAAAALRLAKEARRAVPGGGLGCGLLRYLGDDRALAEELGGMAAEASFNYLGQLDRTLPEGGFLRAAAESPGTLHDPRGRRAVPVEVDTAVAGGRLHAVWRHAPGRLPAEEAEALAAAFSAALAELATLARERPTLAAVASDFPLAGLDSAGLARLLAGRGLVEDVYPLTPAQRTLLDATLETGGEMYVTQMSCELAGALDVPAFRAAWSAVAARHPALRTAFAWEGLERPLQVVDRRVEVPWHEEDWRDLPPTEQGPRLDARLEDERRRGFDLDRAPLLRLALDRLDDDRYRFTWTDHHLVLDGWSAAEVLREVLALYRAETGGPPAGLEPPLPFRDHVAWIGRRNLEASPDFWRRALAGVTEPTRMPGDGDPRVPDGERWGRRHVVIDRATTDALRALARTERVTLGTVVQAAWGLLLGRWTGRRDLVFGLVVAGRPAEIEGGGIRLGLAIDVLPRRVVIDPDARLGDWLRALQDRQVELTRHAHTPPEVVAQAHGLPAGEALFDCQLTFENYPVPEVTGTSDPGTADPSPEGGLVIRDVRVAETQHHALSALVVPGPELAVDMLHDARRVSAAAAGRAADGLAAILRSMSADASRRSLREIDRRASAPESTSSTRTLNR